MKPRRSVFLNPSVRRRSVLICLTLPGSLKRKVRIAQYAVLPKWLFRRPLVVSGRSWKESCVDFSENNASPHLFTMVRGHAVDLKFMALNEAVILVHRLVAQTDMLLHPFRKQKSGWVGALRQGLRDIGWSESNEPKHAGLGCTLALRKRDPDWQPALKLLFGIS